MKAGKHILGEPGGKHIFGTAKIGEKGQIVIPKEARELFGIKPGDSLLILGDEDAGLIISKPDAINEAALKIFKKFDTNKEKNI